MIVLKGKRTEILKTVRKHSHETDVFLKVKPSIYLLAYILNNTRIRRLHVTEGVYRTVSPKVLKALRKMNVEIIKHKTKRGRPCTYPDKLIKRAILMRNKGMSVRQIAKKLNISWRTLYYRLSQKT